MSVGAVDLDPQGSLEKTWYGRRQHAGVRLLEAKVPSELAAARPRMESAGLDIVFVDTPPAHDDQSRVEAGIAAADYVIIPVKPGVFDLAAAGKTVRLARAAGKPYSLIVTQAKGGSDLLTAALAELPKHGDLLPVVMHNRDAYGVALITGQAVIETKPRSEAAREIRAIWAAIKERLYA